MITTDENVNATSSRLFILYLSKNNLSGQFPNWIWNIGSSFGYKSFELELDLSHNILEGLVVLRPNIPSFSFSIVDLSDNKLSGSIPVFAAGIDILDLSNNRFSSEISENVAANLKYARFVSVANNRIFGKIPETICDAENLYLLDLSHNKLSGSIPRCIGEKMSNLSSLILEENEFHGKMPQNYGKDCKLTTLNLNKNQLEGEIPKSLKNCKKLIYLNLGMNQFSDTFPFWLDSLTNLTVIRLHSNRFYGGLDPPNVNCSFSSLKILDISSNNFTGSLSLKCFQSWKTHSNSYDRMLGIGYSRVFQYESFSIVLDVFNYSVTQTVKGTTRDFVNTMFSFIDLSDNRFQGEIPEDIGDLKFLKGLNISSNLLTGPIPPSIGNLTELESLDLSRNNLSGRIPLELASLTSLSVLNLSVNNLVGKIPQGKQFSTFKEDSFLENPELCGFPLLKTCSGNPPILMNQDKAPSKFFTKNTQITFVLSYVAGLIVGILVGNVMLNKKLLRLLPFLLKL